MSFHSRATSVCTQLFVNVAVADCAGRYDAVSLSHNLCSLVEQRVKHFHRDYPRSSFPPSCIHRYVN